MPPFVPLASPTAQTGRRTCDQERAPLGGDQAEELADDGSESPR